MGRCQEPVSRKAQELESVTLSYKVLSESGPDHEKVLLWVCF